MNMSAPRAARAGKSAFKALLDSGLAIPALIILLWWHGSKSGWWSPYILPGPGTVLESLVFLAETGELSRNVTASAARIAKGFSASAAAALAMAFACGVCRPLWRQVSPTVEFLRHIPPMATIPLLILWFGIGELSKLMIIAMATFFPIFLNTAQSVSQCDKRLIEVARAFGYTRAQELRYVVFPASLPYILTGMRLGLGYSWRSLIAAELVAASSGLGYMILGAEQLSRPDVILAGVLVIGLLGSSIDMSLSYLAARLVPYGNASDGVV